MAHHTCDYLIIGNSAAGVTAAEFLSVAAPDKSIIMVSHEPYRCYGRPLISYLLEGKTVNTSITNRPISTRSVASKRCLALSLKPWRSMLPSMK